MQKVDAVKMLEKTLTYFISHYGYKAVYEHLEKMRPVPLKVKSSCSVYSCLGINHCCIKKHYICPCCDEEILWDDLPIYSNYSVCPNCGQNISLDENTSNLLLSEYNGIYLKDKYGIPLSCKLLSLLSDDEERDGKKCSYCRYLWSA